MKKVQQNILQKHVYNNMKNEMMIHLYIIEFALQNCKIFLSVLVVVQLYNYMIKNADAVSGII